MTPRQLQIYRYVERYVQEHSISPSFDEIGTALGCVSQSGVHHTVRNMIAAGTLSYQRGRRRSLRVVPHPIVDDVYRPALVEAREALNDALVLLDRLDPPTDPLFALAWQAGRNRAREAYESLQERRP